MPTATFTNLPEDKKQRIVSAGIHEFSQYRFSHASINRIIKEAAIPRGSFYQYFSGKEDIYLFILELISKEKMEVFEHYHIPDNGDFFETSLASLPAILEWAESKPLYNRIGLLMAHDDSEWVSHIFDQLNQTNALLLKLLEQDRTQGLIRGDTDLELVSEICLQMSNVLLKKYYQPDTTKAAAIDKIKSFFDIIQNGISVKPD